MSSSSSDSDSDEFEPIRKIKINIRPKEEAAAKPSADINEIKASVEAWRPLGPPPHSSLSRRQSSLSSIVSYAGSGNSYGHGSHFNVIGGQSNLTKHASRIGGFPTNINYGERPGNNEGSIGVGSGSITSNGHGNFGLEIPTRSGIIGDGNGGGSAISSSPSCSSLVNDFNNRSSFSNFIYTNSRNSSAWNLISSSDDTKPIAIAIQETIELLVRDCQTDSTASFASNEPRFQSRSFGNIKVAFSNSFAKLCNSTKTLPVLRLRIHSSENIIKYFASRLIKDLDLSSHTVTRSTDLIGGQVDEFTLAKLPNGNGKIEQTVTTNVDPFDSGTSSPGTPTNSRVVVLNMETLCSQLKSMYDQSPKQRYYNLDILRYQISSINSIEACPLQVCAYWKIEARVAKLRIDFKHPDKSGIKLERLSDISFTVDFSCLIPLGVEVKSQSKGASINGASNNDSSCSANINSNEISNQPILSTQADPLNPVSLIDCDNLFDQSTTVSGSRTIAFAPKQETAFEPIAAPRSFTSTSNNIPSLSTAVPASTTIGTSLNTNTASILSPFVPSRLDSSNSGKFFAEMVPILPLEPIKVEQKEEDNAGIYQSTNTPRISYQPEAEWDTNTKRLVWKFDSLVPFHNKDKLCSLFAKLDFRNYDELPDMFLAGCKPSPVDVKFMISDTSLSKIHITVDSPGYKIAMLKREIRSGKYRCEPYIVAQ